MYLVHMARRTPAEAVARNVATAIISRGADIDSVLDAAGVPALKVTNPNGAPELTFGELQDVGGVLSVSPAAFFGGVAHV